MSRTLIISGLWVLLTSFACFSAYASATSGNELVDTVKMAILMIGGLGIVVSIVYQAESMVHSTNQLSAKIAFDKVENSFDLMKHWDNPSLLDARKYTRKIKKKDISEFDLIAHIEGSSNLEHSLVMTFNFWEQVYLSIQENRVNNKLLKKAFGQIYCDMYGRFKAWVNKNSSSETSGSLRELNDLWKS